MKPETIAQIRRFSTERDWEQFHTPANLAKSISIEANELLECFQWRTRSSTRRWIRTRPSTPSRNAGAAT